MSSSRTPVGRVLRPRQEEPRPSTWLERFALPVGMSIMEAPPIGLAVTLITFVFTRTLASTPLVIGRVALLLVGLLWWTMLVECLARRGRIGEQSIARLHLLGWGIALLALVGPSLPAALTGNGTAIFSALFTVALVTWLWRRSMARVRIGFEHGELTTSFKVGFGVLLLLLLVALLLPRGTSLLADLAVSFPLFFFGGLLTLSLARLSAIRTRRLPAGSQADPTRTWLLALGLLGCAIVAAVLLLEAIFSFSSFEALLKIFTPLWNGLGAVVGWLLYWIIFLVVSPIFDLFSWLFSLIPRGGTKPQNQPAPVHHPLLPHGTPSLPPVLLLAGRWVLILLACVVILLIVRAGLRRWLASSRAEEIEEVRESLDARTLLRERWRAWWQRRRGKRPATSLEPLDPESVRFLYRALLQAAAVDAQLARRPGETPGEYEARLNRSLQEVEHGDDSEEPVRLLDELTRAYLLERYGARQLPLQRRAHLRARLPGLLKQVAGKPSR